MTTTRKIRVLHIINTLDVAGAENALLRLVSRLDRQRFETAVVSLRDEGDLGPAIRALSVPVYTVGMRGAVPGPVSVLNLARIARRFKPDVIHGWLYHGNLAGQFARLFTRDARVVWSIHNSLDSLRRHKPLTAAIIWLGARLSRTPDKIVYVSKTCALDHETIGYDVTKSLIFFYGFDTQQFAPSLIARSSVRSELNVPNDAVLIGHVGRYHPLKDHATFMRAAALVLNDYPNTYFLLVGKDIAWENSELSGLAKQLGLCGRIHLLGKRFDIPRLTAAMDIAVSSSYDLEGFPNVIGEAMACGIPCVATDVSDIKEILGSTGSVVQPKNPSALGSALAEMIAIDSEGRSGLGKAARNRVEQKYSLPSATAQYEDLYEVLVGNAILPMRSDNEQPIPRRSVRVDFSE